MSKFPLGQLQFYIFAEIVFGVRCTLRGLWRHACFCRQDKCKLASPMKCLGNRTETGKARINFTVLTFVMKKYLFVVEAKFKILIYFFSFQVLRALKVIAIDKKGSVKMA